MFTFLTTPSDIATGHHASFRCDGTDEGEGCECEDVSEAVNEDVRKHRMRSVIEMLPHLIRMCAHWNLNPG